MRNWHRMQGLLLVAPASLLLLIFNIMPIGYSARLSFYEVKFLTRTWVGFENYATLLRSGMLWNSVRVSSKFFAAYLVFNLVIAYLIALGLDRLRPALAGALRACYYVPVLLSAVITISVWRWFFRPVSGLFDSVLAALGVSGRLWLGDPRIAPWSIAFALFSTSVGAVILLYSAALGQINPEITDAARLDGANEFQLIRFIITPLTQPTRLYVALISLIGAVQLWEHPYFFTQGGPLRATRTMTYEIFHTAFSSNKFGLASAMTTVAILGTLGIAWIFVRKLRLQVG